ncbi:MAG: phosphatidylglycerophosphatase A [Casimicrobiaceae bacterium]
MKSSARRPTLRFLLAHPAHFIALGFGAGLSPWAPGTAGTLLALPIAWALDAQAGDVAFAVVITALFIVGTWASAITGRDIGASDHGAIVIDEIAAFLLVLFFTGTDPLSQGLAFVLFRFFDIVKPPPIGYIDATIKGGIGVMLDDVLAAAYTLLVLAILQRVFG